MKAFGRSAIGFTRADIDITDQRAVARKIKEISPVAVINTAAFHKIEECERDSEKSYQVNAFGAQYVARAAHAVHAAIIYISTDYVFGDYKKKYCESDCVNPLNIYGASKLAGEELTRIVNPHHYIIRTSALFGAHQSGKGHNFVTLMLKLAREGQEITVVDDQYTAPTYTVDLAEKIKELIIKKAPYGIYHITNSGSCSWHEFAKTIFKLARIKPQCKAKKTFIKKGQTRRPHSTVLINQAIQKLKIKPLRPWKEALSSYFDNFLK